VQNRAGGDWFNMEKALSDFKKANANKKIKVEMEFHFDGSSKKTYFNKSRYINILMVLKLLY